MKTNKNEISEKTKILFLIKKYKFIKNYINDYECFLFEDLSYYCDKNNLIRNDFINKLNKILDENKKIVFLIKIKSFFLEIIAFISLFFGILGIFLPILPTTPFLLLSLFLFIRTNQKFYDIILKNKFLSIYVKDFFSDNSIPLKIKIRVIALIWLTIGFVIIFILNKLKIKIILTLIASTVSLYIATRKTKK